jgi:hypothetical protein
MVQLESRLALPVDLSPLLHLVHQEQLIRSNQVIEHSVITDTQLEEVTELAFECLVGHLVGMQLQLLQPLQDPAPDGWI